MAFDADAYVEGLEKPQITIGGETHTGKVFSFNEAIGFAERFDDMAGDDVPTSKVRELAGEVFTLAYGDEVAERVLELPAGAVLEALEDFLACQVQGQSPNGRKTS